MTDSTISRIGVIGCGWLGFPLAKALKEKGFSVNGSTTSTDKLTVLEQSGIVSFLIQLGAQNTIGNISDFLEVDLLIVNVPPGRSSADSGSYIEKMLYLKSQILKSSIHKVIYISSTSVYAENNGSHTEESTELANTISGLRMLEAEKIFSGLANVDCTIIRMAGLIGPGRHPGRFFAGKNDVPNGLAPVNLIHLDDCVGIVCKVIEDQLWNEIFNGVAPSHPAKMDFYDIASQKLYGKGADFISEKESFKVVLSDKMVNKGYGFKYPDLMAFLETPPY